MSTGNSNERQDKTSSTKEEETVKKAAQPRGSGLEEDDEFEEFAVQGVWCHSILCLANTDPS